MQMDERILAEGCREGDGAARRELYDRFAGRLMAVCMRYAGDRATAEEMCIRDRGLPFGFVSTTLLGQVDASVGGKNGVNVDGYKNMAGTFTQPRFVVCDPALLRTLPERDVYKRQC